MDSRRCPTRAGMCSSTHGVKKLALNVVGVAICAAMYGLTARRGVTDPVCRMKVDRAKAVTKELGGETYYFCSSHCLHAFEADPESYVHGSAPPADLEADAPAHHSAAREGSQ